VSINQIKFI